MGNFKEAEEVSADSFLFMRLLILMWTVNDGGLVRYFHVPFKDDIWTLTLTKIPCLVSLPKPIIIPVCCNQSETWSCLSTSGYTFQLAPSPVGLISDALPTLPLHLCLTFLLLLSLLVDWKGAD